MSSHRDRLFPRTLFTLSPSRNPTCSPASIASRVLDESAYSNLESGRTGLGLERLRLSGRPLTPQKSASALRATPLLPIDGSDQDNREIRRYPRKTRVRPAAKSPVGSGVCSCAGVEIRLLSDARYPSRRWGWIPWVIFHVVRSLPSLYLSGAIAACSSYGNDAVCLQARFSVVVGQDLFSPRDDGVHDVMVFGNLPCGEEVKRTVLAPGWPDRGRWPHTGRRALGERPKRCGDGG